MATTWMQVMALVRKLDEKRHREGRIGERDADELISLLLDFHRQTVARTPSGEMGATPDPRADDRR
jgi:hypothetical protein